MLRMLIDGFSGGVLYKLRVLGFVDMLRRNCCTQRVLGEVRLANVT